MRIGRIILVLFGLALIVSLIFAVSTVNELRSAVAEANRAKTNAETVLDNLRAEIRAAADRSVPVQANPTESPESQPDARETAHSDPLPEEQSFLLCLRNGAVCVLSSDGYLIRRLTVDPRALPAVDRAALREGITLRTWKEVLARIEDLEG